MSLLVRGQNTPLHLRKLPYAPDAVAGFAPLPAEPGAVHLDSAVRHPRHGRHAFWAARPFAVLEADADGVVFRRGDRIERRPGADPFEAIASVLRDFAQAGTDLPTPFAGGLAGYFGYDLGRRLERVPETARKDDGFPDLWLGLYDTVVCVDHAAEAVTLSGREGCDSREALDDRMAALAETYWSGLDASEEGGKGRTGERETSPPPPFAPSPPPCSNFTREAYLSAIARAKDHIARGDIYQVNLSQRFETTSDLPPFELYRRLRAASPAPFAAFLNLGGGRAVVSASPERFLRLDGRRVETRPIKGTRPRGATPLEDERLRAELAASEKDRAELVMIVDLERNDLGRVCEPGSVEVSDARSIESYTQVHHGVATVRGTLRAGAGPVDLLRAAFPGGSITGAPKVRAMEIIEALEPTRRSVYTGAIGWIGFDGRMDLSITIRTLLVEGARVTFQAGGGIVADSDPAAEYEETRVKASGLMAALGQGGALHC